MDLSLTEKETENTKQVKISVYPLIILLLFLA